MSALRAVYRYWVSILAAAVVVQVAMAGYGAFYTVKKVADNPIDENTFEDGFGIHMGLGYLIFLGAIVAVILALLARPGKRTVLLTVGALVLLVVQILLAWIGSEVPAVGALHPVNALIIVALLGSLAASEWRAAKTGTSQPAPPPPA